MDKQQNAETNQHESDSSFVDLLLKSFFNKLPENLKPSSPDTPKGRIHLAARELFANLGYKGTSTREIARQAEVNQAMIHYYYGTKESLFRQILLFEILGLFEGMSEVFRSYDNTRDILIHQPMSLVEMIRKDPIRMKIVGQIIFTHTPIAGKYASELGESGPLGFREKFLSIIRAAQEKYDACDADAELIFFYLMSVAYGTIALMPMMNNIFGHDLNDPKVWEEHKKAMESLVSSGLFGGGSANGS